jgi:hypothetical protein
MKNPSSPFDKLRANGERIEMTKKIPFMLRLSKHAVPFLSNLLA